MDILAKLKAEESELRQQLNTIRAAIKIVKAEQKALGKKTNGVLRRGRRTVREQFVKHEAAVADGAGNTNHRSLEAFTLPLSSPAPESLPISF